MQVLLVEDEQALAQFIRKGFLNEGYDLSVAYDGLVGQSLLRQHRYDLIILDVNLPHVNGFELCREARTLLPGVPVLLLTALDSLDDKVMGFEAGADDYLAKPFAFKELLLRARALTRRSTADGSLERQVLRLGDLEMNLTAKVVTRAGQRITLTTREYALLEFLMLNRGKVVTRVDINEKVWDLNFDTNTNVIDVYVSHLRKKIDKQHEQKLIHTVVGMGYEMREG
ncbi:response regulator [Hymenobacter canadensis]|uniref:Response regulator transcription factor n=1 Tax=Hymenobacter canadensis TaxID=2999067 RepID=A0ABY7LWD5_9BACT|nr:response regulator transcription factor [Hymenobacter canadensis]WBA44232.1 response regulator transcription factor [Hymenobacter canadensis]